MKLLLDSKQENRTLSLSLLNPPNSVTGPGGFFLPSENNSRCLILIDGSNFFHKVKNLDKNISLTAFNYHSFCIKLSNHNFPKINYYVGQIRREKHNIKSFKLYSQQQRLFYNLEKQKINIKTGYMLKTKGKYYEKGVDVRIACDILKGALVDKYDSCYLISSDTDLIPAIHDARSEGKNVCYVGFKHQISRALSRNCSSVKVIDKNFLQCFT